MPIPCYHDVILVMDLGRRTMGKTDDIGINRKKASPEAYANIWGEKVIESPIALEGENFLCLFQKDTGSNCTIPPKGDSPELLFQHQTLHPKVLLRNTARDNFVALLRQLLAVTNLRKVCQTTYSDSEAACETATKPSEESCQSEKRSCLSKRKNRWATRKQSKAFLCSNCIFESSAPSSHKPLCKRCSCPSCGCVVKIRKRSRK
ncbi:hypothetical protein PoB_000953900 [Plakobranchus ocellatus]|uniref:Uncharacterized protein n=1 Tax=Plakobranchus ocellatus TaxID=259542 RepID=A0AAV3YLV5_9GAST|nr:hypothetical protein PoB_000953900 [Plakobranchus ocellatus]